ncbi:glycoside hydrolase family 88 protein [Bacteroides clarus]|jgi:unsaturated chondroitin disaccharide hydrolase|uniref:glycoside hydrolase family 88 protein n=1 Tax=Bacteroides clarus TaxID=626929 RepID=UPI0021016C35|nr:glycoside hydrolase family 88 protein [Bacteroides clarus]MCQ1545537.1 glycoside hydrolase family 88 protein [Bacteroides clarus]
MKRAILLLTLALLCSQSILTAQQMSPLQLKEIPAWVTNVFITAQVQSEAMYKEVMETKLLPRSIQKGLQPKTDWTAGFFPGTLWYLYTYTGNDIWKERAKKTTALMEGEQNNAFDHDIGFKMYPCYGNGYLLTGNKDYRHIIFRSAKTLTSRYSYKTGLIMSWEPNKKRDWLFPVIIDNMLNLEILMEAYKISGDTTLKHIAVSHADKTMMYHYRKNMSCPHVVDYEPETGAMRKYDWNNGSDDTTNSTWSRGQSWGLYGFTMMYRETGNRKYLQHAEKIADFLLSHPNMPEDMIPYWDYSASERSKMRDASAAAIMASALMELSTYSNQGEKYFDAGEKQLKSLSSSTYLAKPGMHKNFILMHATGNFLRNSELDGSLSYADYYYIEGLLRYLQLLNGKELYKVMKL